MHSPQHSIALEICIANYSFSYKAYLVCADLCSDTGIAGIVSIVFSEHLAVWFDLSSTELFAKKEFESMPFVDVVEIETNYICGLRNRILRRYKTKICSIGTIRLL